MEKDPAGLLEWVLVSEDFAKAAKAKKLLKFLFNHRDRFVSGEEISKELWNVSPGQHNGEKVRERIHDLKKRLREQARLTEGSFYFEVRDANPREGYRLTFPEKEKRKGSTAFWRAHTRADDVTLVYAQPVFFYDGAKSRYIRYLDTNPADLRTAVAELEIKHGKELRSLYASPLAENLGARTVFVGMGEIVAMDYLAQWFLLHSYLPVRRQSSQRTNGVQEGCPILIGSERTNRFIEALLNSDEGQHFGYRMYEKVGFVTISEGSEADQGKKEEAALKKNFLVRKEKDGRTIAGNQPALSVVRDRLAIVYRMPTPGGRGTITMISSDTSLAIQQVALALTDETEMAKIVNRTEWTEETLPNSFEMLLGVKVAPASIEHEAGLAELLAWRSYR